MSTGLVVFFFAIVFAAMLAACAFTVYLERNFPSEKFDATGSDWSTILG